MNRLSELPYQELATFIAVIVGSMIFAFWRGNRA